MGSIWVYTDPKQAPNEGFCKAGVQTDAGVTQAQWVSEKGILVASDSGTVYEDTGGMLSVTTSLLLTAYANC